MICLAVAFAGCSGASAPQSRPLHGGFAGAIGDIGLGHVLAPEESFRRLMEHFNMAPHDIDCMARELFAATSATPGSTTTRRTTITAAELQEHANRCNVDFSRMSIPTDR